MNKPTVINIWSANVGRIVSDVTRVDISILTDDIHQEYIKHCHDNNKEASFDRTSYQSYFQS